MGCIFNVTDSITRSNPNATLIVHVKVVYCIRAEVSACIQFGNRLIVAVEDGYSASISSYPEFPLPVAQDTVYRLVR